jgi:hypothetical protein
MNHRQARTLCLALAGFFLIVGWWPFTPFPRNHVSWLSGHGLAFAPQGVAYDPEPLPVPVAHPSSNHAPGFAVELSLEPGIEPANGVPHILTIHDGRRPSGFVIGRWQSELLLRVPAAGNPNRIREVGIPDLRRGQHHVIVISGDSSATTLYVDGRLSRRMSNFVLEPGSMRGQLILGNAATGQSSWTGTLFGLAIFNRALEPNEVAAHQNLWTRGTALDLAGEPGLAALYNFTEGTGQETRDHSPAHHHLLIPTRYVVLEKTVLGGSTAVAGWSATRDIVLNVLGFVPFGFLMFRYYQGTSPARWMQAVIISTLSGATLSLIIEVGQVWLPTRNSSLLDLFCNTIGTSIGVLLAYWISESRRRG